MYNYVKINIGRKEKMKRPKRFAGKIGKAGQGMTEYIIIIALVIIAAIVVIRLLGKQSRDTGIKSGKAITEQTEKASSQYDSDKGASDIGQLK